MKIVIVGGVAGGATFAARFRRINENADITIFEKGKHISFANCGLPYHIGGKIKARESLILQTPKSMKEIFNLNFKVEHEVIKIDRTNKKVTVKNLMTNEIFEECYDKLILSPGASPIKPPIPGVNADNIFSLRNITDMDKILGAIRNKNQSAVVVGAGFIGLEIAENLHEKGIEVTVVEMADQLFLPGDKEMVSFLQQYIHEKGIKFHLKNGVKSFSKNSAILDVELQDGKILKADFVILAIGVIPEIALAKDAGLTVDRTIIVNDRFETNDKDIYAIGDAISVQNFITKKTTFIPLAGPANRQARMLADIIGKKSKDKYAGTLGTSILKIFDMAYATTGLNEKQLKNAKIDYYKVYTKNNDHAGYYPNAAKMLSKLLFKPTGEILGAQIWGARGIDKRIDVIATAILSEKKVKDLQNLELSYAPPFNSAKDSVNILGYVAQNVIDGDLKLIYYDELQSGNNTNRIIIDVRPKEVFELGNVKNSINIPQSTLRDRVTEIPKDKEIILSCQTGKKSYFSTMFLKNLGYNAKNLAGGYDLYRSNLLDNSTDYTKAEFENICSQINKDNTVNCNVFYADACGLSCPGPIMKLSQKVNEIQKGDVLEISATDFGFKKDVEAWCKNTGNNLLAIDTTSGKITARIQKGQAKDKELMNQGKGQTTVVFSNDLDKAIASFIIANGAIAMGKTPTLFFTFWGLSILRKENLNKKVKKNFVEKMFSFMLPKGVNKLTLSKMNFGGAGAFMIKGLMKKHNVDSLSKLMESYLKNGGKIIACQMSMDLMGIKAEELIQGVEIGGVATYIEKADNSKLNLFI